MAQKVICGRTYLAGFRGITCPSQNYACTSQITGAKYPAGLAQENIYGHKKVRKNKIGRDIHVFAAPPCRNAILSARSRDCSGKTKRTMVCSNRDCRMVTASTVQESRFVSQMSPVKIVKETGSLHQNDCGQWSLAIAIVAW